MGLFDKVSNIFRKKKNLGLPAPAREYGQDAENESVEPDNTVDIRIYSSTNENNEIEYEVKMNTGENMISLGTITSDLDKSEDGDVKIKKKKSISLVGLRDEITKLIEPLAECKNTYTLTQAKNHIIEKFKEMENKYPGLSLSEGVWDYIEQYGAEKFGYAQLIGLPRDIDVTKLSPEELSRYGKVIDERLKILASIQTADDTTIPRNKEVLLSCMMEQEENNPEDSIVAANFQSMMKGENLDEATVVKIAQNMKKDPINENGGLYPCYLKLEKDRVLRQLYRTVGEAMIIKSEGNKDVMKDSLKKIAYIPEEIENIPGGFSPELLENIMGYMKGMDVEEYIKNSKDNDVKLIKEINENYPDIKHRTEILSFLHARNGSLGQLSYQNDAHNTRTLRDFVANTDFKDPDDTETKNYLLLVARVEEKYIQQEYGSLINKYRENLPFKEKLQKGTIGANKQHSQPEGRVIEPAAFKREESGEGERIA